MLDEEDDIEAAKVVVEESDADIDHWRIRSRQLVASKMTWASSKIENGKITLEVIMSAIMHDEFKGMEKSELPDEWQLLMRNADQRKIDSDKWLVEMTSASEAINTWISEQKSAKPEELKAKVTELQAMLADPSGGLKQLTKAAADLQKMCSMRTRSLKQGVAKHKEKDKLQQTEETSAFQRTCEMGMDTLGAHNALSDLSTWSLGRVAIAELHATQFQTMLKMRPIQKFMDWMFSSHALTKDARFIAELPMPLFGPRLRPLLETCPGATQIWAQKKPKEATQKLVDKIYQFQAYTCKAGSSQISVGLFGCSQAMICLKGVEFVAGIRLAPLETGVTLQDQVKEISSMNGAAFAAAVKSGDNWSVVLRPGSVCLVPSGFVLVSFTPQETLTARKCVSPTFDNKESPVVLGTVQRALEAYEDLRGTPWEGWKSVLEAEVRSS